MRSSLFLRAGCDERRGPKTIVYFERIIFGTLLLGVLHAYLTWDRVWDRLAQFETDPDLATFPDDIVGTVGESVRL
jgi:hypothetical protein